MQMIKKLTILLIIVLALTISGTTYGQSAVDFELANNAAYIRGGDGGSGGGINFDFDIINDATRSHGDGGPTYTVWRGSEPR